MNLGPSSIATLFAGQNAALELAAGGAPLNDVLSILVATAREQCSLGARAAIFIVDAEGARLRFAAASGLADAYTAAVDKFEIGPHSPSCGNAAYTGKVTVVADVDDDPLWQPFLTLAYQHDIRACWSHPICTAAGKVLGMLTLYHRTRCKPRLAELDAFRLLGHTAALVIERHRQESDRLRAEEALQIRTGMLQAVMDHIPQALYVKNRAAKILFANPHGAQLLDATAAAGEMTVDEQVMQQDHGQRVEETFRGHHGVRYLQSTKAPIRDGQGLVVGLVSISHDITERKRTEQLSGEQQTILASIAAGQPLELCLNAITAAVKRLHATTRAVIFIANEMRSELVIAYATDVPASFGLALKGASICALPKGTCALAIHADAPVACEDIAADTRWSTSWRQLCVTHGILACHSEPVPGPDGRALASVMLCFEEARQPSEWDLEIAKFAAYVAGIALRREWASAALRASEARFKAAVDAVQGILWTSNAAGGMEGEQQGWAALTGQSLEEYRGFGWTAAVHPEDRQATLIAWNTALASPSVFSFEHRVRRRDGAWRIYSVRAIPMLHDAVISQWVGVHTDVTIQRNTENELRVLTATLEQRVVLASAERAAALAQVHELQKMEAIGQLTGGVAHDFNNLLMPIVGNLDLLRRKTSLDDRSQRLIEGAMHAAERARTLISRLLTFARRQHLESRAVNLGELTHGMEDLITRSIGPQITLLLELAPDLPSIHVDPNQMELAILNLAVNARDAMPAGGTLKISASAVDAATNTPAGLAPGRYVRLCITDCGCGMSEETLRRSIEPFYSTKGIGKGTGLGLSMVHGLAAQSGGALEIQSEPNAGTSAILWLPVAVETATITAKLSDSPLVKTRPRSILLVDDEELVREGTTAMLVDLGHHVHPAASGNQALDILKRESGIDLLLTDYLMSGMTGADLIREAREIRPGLPALLITGYAILNDDIGRGLPRLAKPFRLAALAAAVAEMSEDTIVDMPLRSGSKAAGKTMHIVVNDAPIAVFSGGP